MSFTCSSTECRLRTPATSCCSTEIPQIGYTLEELNAKRNEPKWRVMRYSAIAIFWIIWAALLAGSILIIVLNNHDVAPTTTSVFTTTVKSNAKF